MLPVLRIHHALIVLAGFGCALLPALVSAGCGPAAVGVEACRKIEGARCDAAAACGFTAAQVSDCKLVYQDQCLHGIENTGHRPAESEVTACVDAVKATAACATNEVATMNDCAGAPVIDDAAGAKKPCDIVLTAPESLAACAFAKGVPDAGTTTTSSTESTGGTGGTTASGGTGGTAGSGAGGVGGTTK